LRAASSNVRLTAVISTLLIVDLLEERDPTEGYAA
jgi:hypothetical protein